MGKDRTNIGSNEMAGIPEDCIPTRNPFETITAEVMEQYRGEIMAVCLDTGEILGSTSSSDGDAHQKLDEIVLEKHGAGRKYAYHPGAHWPQDQQSAELVES